MAEKKETLWPRLEKAVGLLSQITGVIGALAIVAAALVVTEGVVVRKVLGISTVWQTEMAIFLLIYACFVGAAYAQKMDAHLNVDLVIIHLRPQTREMTLVVAYALSALVCAVVAWYAWPWWWHAFVRNEHSESLWGPPVWIPYFFLPLGMTLLLLQHLVTMAKKIRDLRAKTYAQVVIPGELKDIAIPRSDQEGEKHV